MDWERYKALCDTPEVCSRWLLEQTLELLDDQDLALSLRSAMDAPPLPKPADHRGGSATDMFRLRLTLEQANAVRLRLEQASAVGETTRATRERGLGGFVEAWREYEQHLKRHLPGPTDCSTRS